MPATQSGLLVIERILRDRAGIWRQIAEERDLGQLTLNMLASSAIALAFYGAVLGSFSGFLMTLTSAVKLPLLFLVTLAICLPALYMFNLVFGARLSIQQALALVMVAITVIATLSFAFAFISLFFRITSPDYEFFKVLNVAILTLTAFVGLRFLIAGMNALNTLNSETAAAVAAPLAMTIPAPVQGGREAVPAMVGAPDSGNTTVAADGQGAGTVTAVVTTATTPAAPAPAYPALGTPAPAWMAQQATTLAQERSGSMGLLYVWILLFGFVGTQLAWTLRPFFGAPTEEFALFRQIEGNFFSEILNTLGNLF